LHDLAGIVLGDADCQRDLGQQRRRRFLEQILLAERERTTLTTAYQISHDSGQLQRIAGGDRRAIGLVATRPLGLFTDSRAAEHLSQPVELADARDVTDADLVGLADRNADHQFAADDLEFGVIDPFTTDRAGHDLGHHGWTVVGMNHGLTNMKLH